MSTRRVVLRRAVAGFTLVELLIVLVVLTTMVALGLPALQNLIMRSRLEGQARNLSVLVGRARNEAVTQGSEAVVFFDGDEFIAFVDRDGATTADPPDGLLNPVAGAAFRQSDWVVGRLPLDSALALGAPGGQPAIDGLVNDDRPDDQVIFDLDGTLFSTGAFRLVDPRDNFLEVRVGPEATGQVTLRKWDGTNWREQGEEDRSWQWN